LRNTKKKKKTKKEDDSQDDDDENAQQHEYEYERKEQQKKKKKKPKARLGGKGKMGKGTNREFRRQYVFAAATVMSTGKRTPGAVLKFGFPDAVWTKSSSLHKPRAELTQTWREVSLETRAKALFDALDMDPKTAQVEKTLVFVNSGSVCEAISNELANFGAKAASFHSDIDPLERESRIRRFASQDIDVLVATDSVARGVDIPNVKHVVQAEFAQNATEYLHRVGRTARAGKLGRATNILLPGDFDLANAIRKAELENRSVEDTFSRKRSFRNKFKKYGESRRRAA
jgi:superfamily II DNA/RNA helicase